MIIIGHTRCSSESIIERALVLQPVSRIKQNLVFVVTTGHDTKDPRSVVIIGKHLVHGLIDEVRDEVEAELENLLVAPPLALWALLVGHAE